MDITNAKCHEIDGIDFKQHGSSVQAHLNSSVAIDFIEMLTLDANEFLKTKCVCKGKTTANTAFCKDCFNNFKRAIDSCNGNIGDNEVSEGNILNESNGLNIKQLSSDKHNDNIMSSAAKRSCESKNFNNGLLNGCKSGCKLPIKEHNDEKQNVGDQIVHNCDLLTDNNDVVLKNDFNKSDIINRLQENKAESNNEITEHDTRINSLDFQNISNQGCHNNLDLGDAEAFIATKKNPIDADIVGKEDLDNCHCDTLSNEPADTFIKSLVKIPDLGLHQTNIIKNCPLTECKMSNLTSVKGKDSELFNIDKFSLSSRNFITESTNDENSFNSSDITTMETNLLENLDPSNATHLTSVLQDLLNPPSTSSNSSETAPSRHQQESAHGESCASHTSIEADGRWREQAPRCSREFAADVGANDALKRRISQDNTTSNILVNETKADLTISAENAPENLKNQRCCDTESRVAEEHRQHLSWGFRNGRLVFAESKSDLVGSRLDREQVVDSLEGSLKAVTSNPSGNYKITDSHETLSESNSDCYGKEQTDERLRSCEIVNIVGHKSRLLEDTDTPPKILQISPDDTKKQSGKILKDKFALSFNEEALESTSYDQHAHQEPKIEQVALGVAETSKCSTDGGHSNSLNKETTQDILYSKDINRRLEDSNSRIKYLEEKLKKAGLIDQNLELLESNVKVDGCNLKYKKDDSSQNTCKCDERNIQGLVEVDNKNYISVESEVVESRQQLCQCIKVDIACKFNGIDSNLENSVSTLTALPKNHQYNLVPSFDAKTVVSEENKELIDEKGLVPRYTEYSDFQKDNPSLDSNQNVVKKEDDDAEGEDLIPEDSHGLCEFDVNNFSGFSSFNANELSGCYDEFLEDSSSDESCDCDEEEHFIVIRRMRGDGCTMVNEPDRAKHNPDRANLKSLLKKPGRSKDKKSNRVVFNENKNEFFDADYIILIREECDYDEDDDDGVCTCNQHEMVRLTCCEPNCNCQGYDGFEQTPQSPKFAPPIEFVDAVTLSPPEGYKDMEMMAASRGQQRGAVCRECSATHDDEVEEEGRDNFLEQALAEFGEGSQSDSEMDGQTKEQEEKEKTDQCQQTTPTTPPSSESPNNQNYIVETITMTTVTQQQILRDAEDARRGPPATQGSPISGILKGGRLWKQQSQQSMETGVPRSGESNLVSSDSVTSDDETGNRRSVRFIESEEKETRDSCDGAAASSPEEESSIQHHQKIPNIESQIVSNSKQETYIGNSISPDATEMTLTFKLGNHVLISNNSLKPNSAVRQLFPCTKNLATVQGVGEEENSQQYLVTAESLRAFEEAKRSKLPQIIQSGETDETIKRAIERNTLRRSLIRYEPRSKKQPYKTDNSLVERIKQLTCDVDYNVNSEQNQQQSSIDSSDPSEDVLDNRSSPPGEESRHSPDVNTLGPNKTQDKSFSPSSSSSSSSMSLNQNYHQLRKLSGSGEQALMMDLKRIDNMPDIQNNFRRETKQLPDIGGPHNHDPSDPPRAVANQPPDLSHCAISNKMSSSSTTSESRRQFLAPLTACVTMGVAHNEDYYYHLTNHNLPGERISVASSGTEYSLDDIDEALKTEDEEHQRIAPDVLAGTPSASESGDELAMFVQQDAGRIERIKKKYQATEQQPKDNKNNDEDDEHDDYGFNRRPSVRGIKPRFSTTTEILQQIQNQLQPPVPPPSRVAWPYYSESGLTDNSKQKNANQNVPANYQYANVLEDAKTRGYQPQYRPTSLQDENLYQNCTNQRCLSGEIYHRPNMNTYSPVVRMGNEYYQSLPVTRPRNGRPQSPPPMDMSKQYHQTMVYIPYNHIEGYQPIQYYHTGSSDYVSRVSSQNQINKRYVEPIYQSRVHHHVEDHHYSPNIIPPVPPKTLSRVAYPNGQPPSHMMGSRSESPLPGQFSTARSTQTPAPTMSTCGYYPSNPRYRPMIGPVWQGEGNYATKVNRHSFPLAGPRPPADSISLTDSDSQHSGSLPNGYRQSDISGYVSKDSMPNSPTRPRFIERGVPEGAASVSPQDISGVSQSSSSTMTSPTSPQNPPAPTNQKPLFYAMNV